MDIMHSLNELFDEMYDKDMAAEVIGYVDEVNAPQEVDSNKKYKLMKFILNNGSGKRLQCLIWGDETINKYQSDITVCRIVHIERGYLKAVKTTYSNQQQSLVPFELIVQKNTIIHFHGTHTDGSMELTAPAPVQVNFKSINLASGLIRIEGYIKTEFEAVASRFGNSSYGCGAITDKSCKLTVNISNYTPLDIEKGSYVQVTGEAKHNDGPIHILCSDSFCIVEDKNVPRASQEDLHQGIRTPKRRKLDV